MCAHRRGVRVVFRTPPVSIEGGINTLSFVDEDVPTRILVRPTVQLCPAPTPASLVGSQHLSSLSLCHTSVYRLPRRACFASDDSYNGREEHIQSADVPAWYALVTLTNGSYVVNG